MGSKNSRLQAIIAAAVVALGLTVPSAAYAQDASVVATASEGTVVPPEVDDTIVTPQVTVAPDVLGNEVLPGEVAANEVAPQVLAETANNNLAITGSDVVGLAIFALVAILVGSALLAVRRRASV